jgi:DNA-binding MarR family transcriptional regulator
MTEPDTHDMPEKKRLRMLISLLRVTRKSENHLREFLRVKHNTTLPRFDVMAALYREREGMPMSKLSRMLLVSNGNATDVVTRLEKEGLVKRSSSETDRRTISVELTETGLKQFEILATDHQREVNSMFSNLADPDIDQLTSLLRHMSKGEQL